MLTNEWQTIYTISQLYIASPKAGSWQKYVYQDIQCKVKSLGENNSTIAFRIRQRLDAPNGYSLHNNNSYNYSFSINGQLVYNQSKAQGTINNATNNFLLETEDIIVPTGTLLNINYNGYISSSYTGAKSVSANFSEQTEVVVHTPQINNFNVSKITSTSCQVNWSYANATTGTLTIDNRLVQIEDLSSGTQTVNFDEPTQFDYKDSIDITLTLLNGGKQNSNTIKQSLNRPSSVSNVKFKSQEEEGNPYLSGNYEASWDLVNNAIKYEIQGYLNDKALTSFNTIQSESSPKNFYLIQFSFSEDPQPNDNISIGIRGVNQEGFASSAFILSNPLTLVADNYIYDSLGFIYVSKKEANETERAWEDNII